MDNKLNEIKDLKEKQEETLTIVKKLWKAEKWRRFLSILKYAIYIGIIFGAFYFLTPYIERLIAVVQEFKDVKNPQDLQKLLEQLQSPK